MFYTNLMLGVRQIVKEMIASFAVQKEVERDHVDGGMCCTKLSAKYVPKMELMMPMIHQF